MPLGGAIHGFFHSLSRLEETTTHKGVDSRKEKRAMKKGVGLSGWFGTAEEMGCSVSDKDGVGCQAVRMSSPSFGS